MLEYGNVGMVGRGDWGSLFGNHFALDASFAVRHR